MSLFRRLGRPLVILSISVLVLGLAGAGAGYWLWSRGIIQTEAQDLLVQVYFEKIRRDLPFEIESVQVRKNWHEILSGHVRDVSLQIRKGSWRLRLDGPVTFPPASFSAYRQLLGNLLFKTSSASTNRETGKRKFRIDYFPELTVLNAPGMKRKELPSPLSLHLWAVIQPGLSKLSEAGLEAHALRSDSHWNWEALGIHLDHPELHASWDTKTLQTGLRADSFDFENKDHGTDHEIRFAHPFLSLNLPLEIQTRKNVSQKSVEMSAGPGLTAAWKAKSGEALWGDRYFSFPGGILDGNLELSLEHAFKGKALPAWSRGRIEAGSSTSLKQGRPLQVSWMRVPGGSDARVQLRLRPLELKTLIPPLLEATNSAGAPFSSLSFLRSLHVKQGKLSLEGQGTFLLRRDPWHPDLEALARDFKLTSGRIRLRDIGFLWPRHQLAVRGGNLDLPYSAEKGIQGSVAIQRFGYRKLRGSLGSTPIQLRPSANGNFPVRIGEKSKSIPFRVEGLPLRIASLSGEAGLPSSRQPQSAEASRNSLLPFNLRTSADLMSASAEKLFHSLCLTRPETRIPPVQLRVHLPSVNLSPGAADLTGFVRADLFGGRIQADQMGVYDFFSEVPEFDFNLTMSGIDLNQLGNWLNFGKMDGTLTGYAHDVVFQSWLPTQYDLQLQINPFHHSDVVFSTDAMKNFARIFAEDGIDHIPGIAKWLAFGWPSRLLGGYNIDYAGIHLHSQDGYIQLETLDPARRQTDGNHFQSVARNSQKHFILYGRRFKMPLRSARYPLILDATAMGNFVHRKWLVLSSLSKSDDEKTGKSGNTGSYAESYNDEGITNEENSDSAALPPECIPTDLSHL